MRKQFRGFVLPTTTPVPDQFFDELLEDLTLAETRVLLYIIRRTFGFRKLSDNISLKQMVAGIKTRDGRVIDHGVGLSKSAICKALATLEKRHVIIRTQNRSPERGDEPTTYSLNVLTAPVTPRVHGGGQGVCSGDDAPLSAQVDTPVSSPEDRGVSTGVDMPVSPPVDTQQTAVQERVQQQVVVAKLKELGVTDKAGQRLLREHEPAHLYRWIAYLEHRLASGWAPKESPAAWLLAAIRSGDWQIPSWFRTPEEEAQSPRRQMLDAEAQRLERERVLEERRLEKQRARIERDLGIGPKTKEIWEQVRAWLEEHDESTVALHGALLLPLRGNEATVVTGIQFFARTLEAHREALQEALRAVTGREALTLKITHDPSLQEEATG